MRSTSMGCRTRAFTLIELLIVIGIIAVLAGLLLPVFSGVKEKANETKCANNLHSLGAAFLLFAGEHNNQLPGTYDTRDKAIGNPDLAYQGSWLSGSTGDASETTNVPRNGTIFPYVGSNLSVYRCPSLPKSAAIGDGKGSNGLFDYAFFCRLGGARLQNIPAQARLRGDPYPMPMLIEEDPAVNINNTASGGNINGTHTDNDQAAQTHRMGCNYVSIDGSVHRLATIDKTKPFLAGEWVAVLGPQQYLNIGKPKLANYGDWADGGLITTN